MIAASPLYKPDPTIRTRSPTVRPVLPARADDSIETTVGRTYTGSGLSVATGGFLLRGVG
jgi:hypothetical protein